MSRVTVGRQTTARRRISWARCTATPGRTWWRYSWTRTWASPGKPGHSSVVSFSSETRLPLVFLACVLQCRYLWRGATGGFFLKSRHDITPDVNLPIVTSIIIRTSRRARVGLVRCESKPRWFHHEKGDQHARGMILASLFPAFSRLDLGEPSFRSHVRAEMQGFLLLLRILTLLILILDRRIRLLLRIFFRNLSVSLRVLNYIVILIAQGSSFEKRKSSFYAFFVVNISLD